MTFDHFFDAQNTFLIGVFLLALIMGAVVIKTNFCTMGAVSDLVNMGDSGRMRARLLAIAGAVLGVLAVAGASTLALGSIPAFAAIVLGRALIMKVQYRETVYEDGVTVVEALVTGLVDLKLLPERLRRLEAI